TETEPKSRRLTIEIAIAPFEDAIPVARVHARRKDLDAMPLGVLHDRSWRVEAHRLTVDERRRKRRGVMDFQPRACINEEREARRVALGETIFPEPLDRLVETLSELA